MENTKLDNVSFRLPMTLAVRNLVSTGHGMVDPVKAVEPKPWKRKVKSLVEEVLGVVGTLSSKTTSPVKS